MGAVWAFAGFFLVVGAYMMWSYTGSMSQEKSPFSLVMACVATAVSVAVVWAIHSTIEHDAAGQVTAASYKEEQLERSTKQIDIDRDLYRSLLAPLPPVVSEERKSLQDWIEGQQSLVNEKRRQKFDRPADRMDANVKDMQIRLEGIVRLDAERTRQQAADRQAQAQKLLESIQEREGRLSEQSSASVGIASGSGNFIMFISVLIEAVCSLLFFATGRMNAQIKDSNALPEVAQVEVLVEALPHSTPIEKGPGAQKIDSVNLVSIDRSSPEAASGIVVEATALKPTEEHRYRVFLQHILSLSGDEPIQPREQASALGFGKDLISGFFKAACAEGLIEKRGRQWYHASQAN